MPTKLPLWYKTYITATTWVTCCVHGTLEPDLQFLFSVLYAGQSSFESSKINQSANQSIIHSINQLINYSVQLFDTSSQSSRTKLQAPLIFLIKWSSVFCKWLGTNQYRQKSWTLGWRVISLTYITKVFWHTLLTAIACPIFVCTLFVFQMNNLLNDCVDRLVSNFEAQKGKEGGIQCHEWVKQFDKISYIS